MNQFLKILTLLMVFITSFAKAQQIDFLSFGAGELPAFLRGSTRDSLGNYYHFGDFRGALVVNGDTILYGNGSTDLFLYKTDSLGNTLWVKNYGTAATETSVSRVYIYKNELYGIFRVNDRTDINGFRIELVNNSMTTCLVKFDTSGNAKWVMPTNAGLSSEVYFYSNKVRLFGSISRVNGAVLVKDSIILSSTGFNNRFFIDVGLDGAINRVFNVFQNNNFNTGFNMIATPNLDYNQFYLLVQTTNAGIQAGNNRLRVHETILPIPRPVNMMLIKTDTNFNVLHHRILNTNGGFQVWNMNQDRLSITERGDSITMLLNPGFGSFELGQDTAFSVVNSLVAVFDTSLAYKGVVPLSGMANSNIRVPINYYRLFHHNGAKYYFGLFRGLNQVESKQPISPNIEQVTIFKGASLPFNLNGPSISFVVKETAPNQSKVTVLGNHSLYEEDAIRMQGFETTPDGILFCNPSDNRFNPWKIDNDIKVKSGAMLPRIANAPTITSVQYFEDGSRLVVGSGVMKSIFEDLGGQPFDTTRPAHFFSVVQPDNRAKRFHRMFTSFSVVNLLKQVKKNNKVYLLYNFAGAKNQPNQNFISINNESIIVPGDFSPFFVNAGYKVLFVIDESGNLTHHNLFDLNIGPARTFDVFDNGDLLVGSLNEPRSLQANGINFPTDEGFYLGRFTLNRQLLSVIKVFNNVNPRPVLEDIQILPDDDAFILTTGTVFINSNISQQVNIVFNNGSIGQFQLNNQYPEIITSRNYLGFVKVNFNRVFQSGTIGPVFYTPTPLQTFTPHGFYAGLVNTAGITEPLRYNGNVVSASNTPGRSFLLKFDQNLQLKHQITFNSVGSINNIQFIPARVVEKNGSIYVAGRQNQPLSFGAVSIPYLGETDGLVMKFDSLLNMTKYFALQSPNFEQITDVDVFNDSVLAFAASAVTPPRLLIGPQEISSSSRLRLEDLGPVNYLGKLNLQTLAADLVYTKQQGDWHNPDTWTTGKVPDSATRVVIAHKIQVTQAATCKTIYLNGTGNLNIQQGVLLNITGQESK